MIYLGGFYWFTICLKNLPKNDQFFAKNRVFYRFSKIILFLFFKRKTLLLLGKCPNGLKIGIDVPWGYLHEQSLLPLFWFFALFPFYRAWKLLKVTHLYYTSNTGFCCLIWQYKPIHKSHPLLTIIFIKYHTISNKHTYWLCHIGWNYN